MNTKYNYILYFTFISAFNMFWKQYFNLYKYNRCFKHLSANRSQLLHRSQNSANQILLLLGISLLVARDIVNGNIFDIYHSVRDSNYFLLHCTKSLINQLRNSIHWTLHKNSWVTIFYQLEEIYTWTQNSSYSSRVI